MEGFTTPKSREWTGVTVQQAVVNGNCKSIKCNYCEKVFAGNAGRIRAHYLKCPACPAPLRDYCVEQKKMADERVRTRASLSTCRRSSTPTRSELVFLNTIFLSKET